MNNKYLKNTKTFGGKFLHFVTGHLWTRIPCNVIALIYSFNQDIEAQKGKKKNHSWWKFSEYDGIKSNQCQNTSEDLQSEASQPCALWRPDQERRVILICSTFHLKLAGEEEQAAKQINIERIGGGVTRHRWLRTLLSAGLWFMACYKPINRPLKEL